MTKKYLSKSVLVVEDHPDARRILSLELEHIGFNQVKVVANALEAQEELQNQQADLILADWNLPEMSGLELLKLLRANEATKHIKFLMVTADDDQKRVLEAILAGADGYLIKPVIEERLQQKLDDIFKDEMI